MSIVLRQYRLLGALEQVANQNQENQAKSGAFRPSASTIADDIAQYEKSIGGAIPLSLRAWCEIVAGIFINPDFTTDAEKLAVELRAVGVHATTGLWKPQPPLADPLAIACNFEEADEKQDRWLVLGVDDHTEAGIHGGSGLYCSEVPNYQVADADFGDRTKLQGMLLI